MSHVPDGSGSTDGDPVRWVVAARVRDVLDVEGRVVTASCAPGRLAALDVVVDDGTGTLLCHFMGRTSIPGIVGGARVHVHGTLVTYRSRRCLLNPAYELLDGDAAATGASS